MTNPTIRDFLIEIWNRLRTKSPKIFRVLQLLGASLTLAGYIPSMLQQWFNVEVSGNFISLCEDVSKYAAGFFAAALLPAKSPPVAQTEEGKAIIVHDEKKMPFTSKVEEKEIDKAIPPLEVVPEVKPEIT